MHFLYNILVILVVIFAMPIFLVRSIQEKGIGERVRQSFGFLPKDVLAPVAGRGCIWLHAASVGEIVATSPIVKEIRKELPGIPILVSVVTATGYTMAKRIIHEADSIIFFPLDLPWLSNLVVKRISPRAFLPVETELWPNFLQAARNSKIPVMMVNGRISDKSVRRYHYLRGVLKEMLATVVQFCMQSNVDAKYVIRLGADPQRVVVTGNTKFDQTYTDVSYAEREILCSQMGLKDCHPIMIAGSTHKGEEELVISAYKQIRDSIPSAKLLIAPRDTLRAEEVANLATSHGLAAARRTILLNNPSSDYDIVVLDTIGELGKIYSIGDIIYVGGSLIPHGGHNILEPAAHGKPILVGPHMFNFKDTYALFSGREACVTVGNAAELAEK
ncbi:MAG TPA: 3-deoxy-D-manno-octulosonic acid transferase, partial [Negativicutes bacterium]